MNIIAKERLLRYQDMIDYLEKDIGRLKREGREGKKLAKEIEKVYSVFLEVYEKLDPTTDYSQRLLIQRIR